MIKTVLVLLLATTSVFAANVCTTINATGYSQNQINLVLALAAQLGAAAGTYTGSPSVTQSGTDVSVCFDSPSFNVETVITTTTLTNQYQADNAARNAAKAQWDAWETELSTTTTALNSARIAGVNNLTAQQQRDVIQGVLQWLWLRQKLGIDQ